MKRGLDFFGIVSLANAALFFFLFVQLQFTPEAFVQGLGLEPGMASTILCRRASMLFLGTGVMLALLCKLSDPKARRSVCLGMIVTMFGFASMGSLELVRGTVNSSVLMAAIIEAVFGLLYVVALVRSGKSLV
jgi:hypothetical protein